jgi:nucleotide-binding universal stress UspA family protein
MFKKILLPFDGLKSTSVSAGYAIELAKTLGAKLYFLHVLSFNTFSSVKSSIKKSDSQTHKYCIDRTREVFDILEDEAKKENFKDYQEEILFAENVISGISKFVEKEKIDLCLIQPSPYYHSEMTGDLARKISEKIKVPFLFVKTKSELRKNSRILIPIDEKEENLVSVRIGVEIAKQINGKIIFYHTTWRREDLDSEDVMKHCDEEAISCLSSAKKMAEGIENESIVEMQETIEGGIIGCAVRTGADLIIMTNSRSIIGGKAELVLDNSMYPMLIIKK